MPHCDICEVAYPSRLETHHKVSARHQVATTAAQNRDQLTEDGYAQVSIGRDLQMLTEHLIAAETAYATFPAPKLVAESWAPAVLLELLKDCRDGRLVKYPDGGDVFIGAFVEDIIMAYGRLDEYVELGGDCELFNAFVAAVRARALDVALDIAKEIDS